MSFKSDLRATRNTNLNRNRSSTSSYLNTSCLEKTEKVKKTKSLRQILHNEVDYYHHSHQVFEALNNLRQFPRIYIEKLEELKKFAEIDNTGAFVKISDYILRCTKYDIEEAKQFLERLLMNSTYKSETIMWNEKLQQVGTEIVSNLNDVDYLLVKKDLTRRVSSALNYACECLDFVFYHYLDPVLSVLVILLENPKLRDRLLCESFHFGAVSCGSFKEVAAVTIVFLVNKSCQTVAEEEYFELDINDKVFDYISYKSQIKDGVIVESDGFKHVVCFTLVDGTTREEVFYMRKKNIK